MTGGKGSDSQLSKGGLRSSWASVQITCWSYWNRHPGRLQGKQRALEDTTKTTGCDCKFRGFDAAEIVSDVVGLWATWV